MKKAKLLIALVGINTCWGCLNNNTNESQETETNYTVPEPTIEDFLKELSWRIDSRDYYGARSLIKSTLSRHPEYASNTKFQELRDSMNEGLAKVGNSTKQSEERNNSNRTNKSGLSEERNNIKSPGSDYQRIASDRDIEKHFSGFDGSFTKFRNYIKDNLNDPSSFKHVETRFNKNSDGTITVYMKYRGKNAFNATLTKIAKCTLDVNTGAFTDVVAE